MAKSKKKSVKKATSSKKAAKKSAKKTVAKRRVREAPVLMSSDEKRKRLKPREGYEDLTEELLRAWENDPKLKVPDLTPARLRSLVKKAVRSATRETEKREELARKLAPLSDARVIDEDALWRAVLDVNAAVKLYARSDPAMSERFAFLTEVLSSARTTPDKPTETDAPDEG